MQAQDFVKLQQWNVTNSTEKYIITPSLDFIKMLEKKPCFFTASPPVWLQFLVAYRRRYFTTVTHTKLLIDAIPLEIPFHTVAQLWRTAEAWSPQGAQDLMLNDVKVQNDGSDMLAGYQDVDKNNPFHLCKSHLSTWVVYIHMHLWSTNTHTNTHTGEDRDPKWIPGIAPGRRATVFNLWDILS